MQEFNVKINCQILHDRTRSTLLRFSIVSPEKMMIPSDITNNEELHHYLFGDSATNTEEDLREEGTDALFPIIDPMEGEVRRTLRGSLGPMPFVSDGPPRVLHFYQTKTIVVLKTFLISIEDDNSNSNNNDNNNNNNNNAYTINNNNRNSNNNSNNSDLPTKNIAANAENAIMYNTISNGNIMANFHDEFQRGRYYKKANVQRLLTTRNPVNPHTRAPLKKANITYYKAKISGGRGKRRTLKRGGSRSSRSSRRRTTRRISRRSK